MRSQVIKSFYLAEGCFFNEVTDKKPVEEYVLKYAENLDNSYFRKLNLRFSMSRGNFHDNCETLREICRTGDLFVTVIFSASHIDHVKKVIYSGASAIAIEISKREDLDLYQESVKRFGKEKVFPFVENYEKFLEYKKILAYNAVKIYINSGESLNDFENLPIVNWRNEREDFHIAEVKWEDMKKDDKGLIPVIVQDYRDGTVLMLAYMDSEAFNKTVESGRMTYFSRSRNKLWLKGETSGHFQYLKSLYYDCDSDTLLAKVKQIGPACHTGARSCFYREILSKDIKEETWKNSMERAFSIVKDRKTNPREGSYTNYLYNEGLDKILKKVGEEASETIISAKNSDREDLVYEVSDLFYHVLVLLAEKEIEYDEILKEMDNR